MSAVSKYPRWLLTKYADSGVRMKGTAEGIDTVDSCGEMA
jgi:hypothetical protein